VNQSALRAEIVVDQPNALILGVVSNQSDGNGVVATRGSGSDVEEAIAAGDQGGGVSNERG
jgi:hypothetical protein